MSFKLNIFKIFKIFILAHTVLVIYLFSLSSNPSFQHLTTIFRKQQKSQQPNRGFAVISVNLDTDSDYYLFYLPIVCMSWRIVGFEPIVFAVFSERNESTIVNNKLAKKTIEYLELFNVKLRYLKSLARYSKMSGMLARLLVGIVDDDLVKDDDFIFQTDADLLPINKKFYNRFDDSTDSIKLLDISSYKDPIKGKYKFKTKNYKMLYMAHIGMQKKQWREVLNLNKLEHKFDGQTILTLIKGKIKRLKRLPC